MALVVDARGLPCPQPVILTRNAMHQAGDVTTIVDNETAQRNVTRMAERAGATVVAERSEDGTYLRITGSQVAHTAETLYESGQGVGPLVVVASSESMGRGEHPELGQILVRAFFHTLGEVLPLPDVIVFYNSGVKLVSEGSPVVPDLRDLAGRGVQILACGTCLGYYHLQDRVAVGEVSNMYTIAETLLRAGKTVTL